MESATDFTQTLHEAKTRWRASQIVTKMFQKRMGQFEIKISSIKSGKYAIIFLTLFTIHCVFGITAVKLVFLQLRNARVQASYLCLQTSYDIFVFTSLRSINAVEQSKAQGDKNDGKLHVAV